MTTMTLERPFPTAFEQDFAPLMPDEGLGAEADTQLTLLADHGLVAARGIHLAQAVNLAAIADDPKVVEYCPRDYTTRFGTIERQRNWVAKGGGRAMLGIYYVRGQEGPVDLDDARQLTVHDVAMVADAWGGPEANRHIPGADITTAYRVGSLGSRLARESRRGEGDRFSLGLPLGILTLANLVNHHGVPPHKISLENWESNEPAGKLYSLLGFHEVDGAPRLNGTRPTLKSAGTVVNGNVVRYQRDESGAALTTREVDDRRVFQVLDARAA